MLLALEAVHIHGQFGGSFHLVEENEAPAFELRPVAEVHVLGERVVLPTAGVGDAGFPPDAAGAVEGEEAPGTIAGGLLQLEVAVEEHRLDAGQHVESPVEVAPTGLDHADLVIGKIMDCFLKQVGIGDEVRVENEKILALGETGAVFKRASLVAGAVGAVNVLGIETTGFQALNPSPANFDGLIRRVVQKLDLHLVLRVIQRGDGCQQAVHHVHFIENRELDGHQRQLLEQLFGLRMLPRVFQIEKNDRQPVRAVASKADENNNVRCIPKR